MASYRRKFVGQLTTAAGAASLVSPWQAAYAAQSGQQTRRFDLLIKGGHVVDAGQQLSVVADVAILDGKIAAVRASIDEKNAARVFDASGHIVCPGLIDAHGHVADGMMPVSIDPDIAGIPTCVTTIIDAGSTGARNFPAFRKYIIKPAETRIYALLNIGAIGLTVLNELYLDPKIISVKRALRAIRANRDIIIGLKARIRGGEKTLEHDIGIMKTMRGVADETGLPMMMHWSNKPELLDLLWPGDCMTHPFNPDYLGQNAVGADGKVHSQALELKDRGIMVDLGHGSSFDWRKAEKAAEQGFYPDTISTDMFSRYFGPKGVVVDQGTTMSKFIYLGLSLERVIEMSTAAPVRMFNIREKLGSLAVGAIADVAIMKKQTGLFDFMDSPRLKQIRIGKERLVPHATVKGGRLHKPR